MDPQQAIQFLATIIAEHARITENERNQVVAAFQVISMGLAGVAPEPPQPEKTVEEVLKIVKSEEDPQPSRQVRRATTRKSTAKK